MFPNKAVLEHGKNFYGKVILNPSTFAQTATSTDIWTDILGFHHLLSTDEYVQYVDAWYREGVRRFGQAWFYLDIVNVLYTAGKLLQPRSYLEIGVRRGRSVCTVARACPTVDIVAFDMWIQNYAGMDNPGPSFVREQLRMNGHRGKVEFIDGDSHETVPAYLQANADRSFDLITVDGDHTRQGAYDDLCTVVPQLAVGGMLVFDDIAHPEHGYLLDVWMQVMQENPQLRHYPFVESGYGVAFAIRAC